MTLKTDIQQIFGVQGSSDKFNTHVSATGNSKGLFARETNPPSLDVLCAEFTNIIVDGKAFSSLNAGTQAYINGLAYASISAGGESTVEIDTLLGVAFTDDVLLLYAFNNGGDLDFGLYSENNGDFTSNDPQTYFSLSSNVYVIAEITTNVGMTMIDDSKILDVRQYNQGAVSSEPEHFMKMMIVRNLHITSRDPDEITAYTQNDKYIYIAIKGYHHFNSNDDYKFNIIKKIDKKTFEIIDIFGSDIIEAVYFMFFRYSRNLRKL